MTAQSTTAMQSVKGPAPGRQGPVELLEQFDKVYDSIARRAFELFKGNGQTAGHELDDWIRAEAELLHPVRLEVTESDESLTVLAEVPGFGAKDVEIKVEPQRLIIAGRREIKEEKNGQEDSLRMVCRPDFASGRPAEGSGRKQGQRNGTGRHPSDRFA